MPLPIFKTRDEIPEVFRAEYEEREGQWHPKAAPDDGLKTALQKERDRADAAEKLAAKAARELATEQQKKKAEEAGLTEEQLQKLRADVRADLEKDFAPFKTTAETLAAENRALKLDSNVKSMLAKAGFLPEKIDSVWKLHADEFDLTADGKPMLKGKPGIDPVKHITDSLVKSYPEWVRGTQATGGGAKGGAGTTTAKGDPSAADAVLRDPLAMLQKANAEAASA